MRDREWLVSPEAIDLDGYRFGRIAIGDVRANEGSLHAGQVDRLRADLEDLSNIGISFEDTGSIVVTDWFLVVLGDIDEAAAESGLTELGLDASGQYQGFQVYDDSGAVGVSTDALVVCPMLGPVAPRERLEAVIDAAEGRANRFHEVVEDCDAMLSELGRGMAVGGEARTDEGDPGDGANATGRAYRLDGDRMDVRVAFVFEDASSVDFQQPEDASSYGLDTTSWENAQLSVDGRIARIDAEMAASDATFYDGVS